MTQSEVEFGIETEGAVSPQEIAEAVAQLISQNRFAYNKPKIVSVRTRQRRESDPSPRYARADVKGGR